MALIETERTTRGGAGKGKALSDWVRALEATATISANPRRILPDVFAALAESHGAAPALIAEHETLTFRMLTERVNRYARWALGQQLAMGETVC
jgi:fatty-acyl-CoA synthase